MSPPPLKQSRAMFPVSGSTYLECHKITQIHLHLESSASHLAHQQWFNIVSTSWQCRNHAEPAPRASCRFVERNLKPSAYDEYSNQRADYLRHFSISRFHRQEHSDKPARMRRLIRFFTVRIFCQVPFHATSVRKTEWQCQLQDMKF